jgi:uncharacterized DUF497 family protein
LGVRLSAHAVKRMAERGISTEEVKLTLDSPTEVMMVRHGRRAACRHFPECQYVVVIFEAAEEELIVVTAVKVDEERVRRYGFSGV